jgi:hypothetical protein
MSKTARKSFTLSPAMMKRLAQLSKKWGVSEAEVLRRLFGLGDLVVTEIADGHKIYSQDPETEEQTLVKFAFP